MNGEEWDRLPTPPDLIWPQQDRGLGLSIHLSPVELSGSPGTVMLCLRWSPWDLSKATVSWRWAARVAEPLTMAHLPCSMSCEPYLTFSNLHLMVSSRHPKVWSAGIMACHVYDMEAVGTWQDAGNLIAHGRK